MQLGKEQINFIRHLLSFLDIKKPNLVYIPGRLNLAQPEPRATTPTCVARTLSFTFQSINQSIIINSVVTLNCIHLF